MSREWLGALRPAGQPAPASKPSTVARARRVLGDPAVAWAIEASIAINDEVLSAARADPRLPLTGLELSACEAGLLAVLQLMRTGRDAPVSAPEEAVEQVRLAVRQGTPIDSVVRVVWMCHTGVQERLLAIIGDVVPPADYVAEVRELTRDLQVFADLMARELSAAFEAERLVWQDRLAVLRRRVVEEIVRTGHAPEGAEPALGFPLTGHHLAALLWPVDPVPEEVHGEHRRYVTSLTAAAGARSMSLLDNPDGSLVVLWSFPVRPGAGLAETLRKVDRPARTALAIGPVGAGAQGLRQSVLGARETRAVLARSRTAGVRTYEDVALLGLLLADEEPAGRFVRSVLAGLTGRDSKSAAVRETLAAYLRHGRGRTAAAQELRLAANTVAYRVRQAEEALGRPAVERTLDTMIALKLAAESPDLLRG